MKRLNLSTDSSTKKRYSRIIKIGIVAILIGLSLEIYMVNRLSTYGSKIQQLQDAQANLQLENQILENEISQKSSLVEIEKKGAKLGFGNIKSLEFYQSPVIASAN